MMSCIEHLLKMCCWSEFCCFLTTLHPDCMPVWCSLLLCCWLLFSWLLYMPCFADALLLCFLEPAYWHFCTDVLHPDCLLICSVWWLMIWFNPHPAAATVYSCGCPSWNAELCISVSLPGCFLFECLLLMGGGASVSADIPAIFLLLCTCFCWLDVDAAHCAALSVMHKSTIWPLLNMMYISVSLLI